ncbi:MAG: MBL fold metallo-hydrolase [Deltaproteobacteria bacterium]|nr:MBL fold metallo-hydrolase [Deltaproteobacteria bacterium]
MRFFTLLLYRLWATIFIGCSTSSETDTLVNNGSAPYTSNPIGDAIVHVIDVGQALCTITETPDGHYMIYDTGHWQGEGCLNAALNLIKGDTIDLMVLSHTDADHLGDAAAIMDTFDVKQIIRTGIERETATWLKADEAMSKAIFGFFTCATLGVSDGDIFMKNSNFKRSWRFANSKWVTRTDICGSVKQKCQ